MTEFDADMIREIMNNYILFYRTEIEDIELFKGIDMDDMASTNIQMEALYSEMNKFSKNPDKLNCIKKITEQNNQLEKFVICENDVPYCTSEFLFAVLLEIIDLKNDNPESNFKIKLKVNMEKK